MRHRGSACRIASSPEGEWHSIEPVRGGGSTGYGKAECRASERRWCRERVSPNEQWRQVFPDSGEAGSDGRS
ncbi:hypothetical protein GUJ93_ZPchr0009g1934 [Zizania palustris]|uniref:Uncharacterized protein n=1 Tax=Zizania palustris TaxID=103762 RepID=A0A8J5RLS3_ZIZPA|nr:hypothetical protein GUJ93_ZPchr0009g1934 [Zizania palustris]